LKNNTVRRQISATVSPDLDIPVIGATIAALRYDKASKPIQFLAYSSTEC
jgi:hypothetical protein